MRTRWLAILAGLLGLANAVSQQTADKAFAHRVVNPAYALGAGPRVAIDEAHHNYHTGEGRYRVFAELLRKDGFRVTAATEPFSRKSLAGTKILVIANALHESNRAMWELPTPSAFTAEEIAAVRGWVNDGGSLLLIADHMPFPGAAAELGKAFGFQFGNGYARGPEMGVFRKVDGSLRDHVITRGRDKADAVGEVRTFTGQAFKADPEVAPLLVFGKGHSMLMTKKANAFPEDTPRVDIDGWLHAGVREFGKGRVAVFGEAAMFTAQRSGRSGKPMGMNAPGAEQNPRLCLNVMRWLSGALDPAPTSGKP